MSTVSASTALGDALAESLAALVARGYRVLSPTGGDVSHRLVEHATGPLTVTRGNVPVRRIGDWLYTDGAWTPIEEESR